MFTKTSMTGAGAIIVVLEQLFSVVGITFPEGTIGDVVHSIVVIVGFILLVWGQVRRQDLTLGLFRK